MRGYGFGFGSAGGGAGSAALRPTLNLRDLATWQAGQNDPNNLLQSITMVGRYLKPVLQSPATVSPAPNQAWSVSVPLFDLLGRSVTVDPWTMLCQALLQTLDDDPIGSDGTFGVGIGNGPVASLTEGLAIAFIKSTNDHKMRKWVLASGGSWTSTDASAAGATVVGGRLCVFNTNSSLQRGCNLVPVDANGNPVTTSNLEPINTASSTMSASWTHLFAFAGWQTGSGGSVGWSPTIRASELVLKLPDLVRYERANPP